MTPDDRVQIRIVLRELMRETSGCGCCGPSEQAIETYLKLAIDEIAEILGGR